MVAIILAAGKGTRMKSSLPKALHPICGKPMTRFVIDACKDSGIDDCIVVIGHGAEEVREGLGDDVRYVIQSEQHGTGDACKIAMGVLDADIRQVIVLPGDAPMITSEVISDLMSKHESTDSAATMLTTVMDDAGSYGRIIRDGDGVRGIVEAKDATDEQKKIREINAGVYCFDLPLLRKYLHKITPANAQGEYYLTDVIELMVADGLKVSALVSCDTDVAQGINDRVSLAFLSKKIREKVNNDLMLGGVTMIDPETTYVDCDVEVGRDTVIYPQTILESGTVIGGRCNIGPGSRLVNSRVGDEVTVLYGNIVDSEIGDGSKVGPFSNLRPGTKLGKKVKIGDFVETKNAIIGDSVSMSHLTYVGDAEVGEHSNLGAGTITCNYDGYKKSRTTIGKNVFVGSNTILVAPVEVGDGSLIAAGSVVTEAVPSDALAIARPPLVVKEEWAKRRRERLEGGSDKS